MERVPGHPISKGREARGNGQKGQRGGGRQVPREPRVFRACKGRRDQLCGVSLLGKVRWDQGLLWRRGVGGSGMKVRREKGRGAADGKG